MNVTKLMRRKAPECPTCRQPIVEPAPSIVAAARAMFAAFGLGAALLEYRRALKREAEAAQLSAVYDTPTDQPLDEHLAQREQPPPPPPPWFQFDEGVIATPWPPAHPSLAAEPDASPGDDANA